MTSGYSGTVQLLPTATQSCLMQKKCHIEAAKRGETRTEKLNSLYGDNRWVDMFYAPYTFEVDFANESRNHRFIETVIKAHYTQETAIDGHVRELSGTDDAKRYDTVLTVAKELGKGWYATLLSTVIDETVIIPSYMLQALAFVSQSIIDEKIVKENGTAHIRRILWG